MSRISSLGALMVGMGISFLAMAQTAMPRIDLTIGFLRINAEVAANSDDIRMGLMHRTSMPAHHGMLFVFPNNAQHCMWMKNTLIPLSVAFLDKTGTILNIEDMQPQTLNHHCATAPARYALEMNRGWFASRGVGPGQRIGGLENAPKPR